jgi:hypothetical protein
VTSPKLAKVELMFNNFPDKLSSTCSKLDHDHRVSLVPIDGASLEWRGWIDNIRSWSRLVKHHGARFAATALAGPPSARTWYLAHAHSLIATRIARDEALTICRCCTASANTVSVHGRPFNGSRIRGPPRTQSASRLRHKSHCVRSACFVRATPHRGAAFSNLLCRMRKIAEHRIATETTWYTLYS